MKKKQENDTRMSELFFIVGMKQLSHKASVWIHKMASVKKGVGELFFLAKCHPSWVTERIGVWFKGRGDNVSLRQSQLHAASR